MKIGLSTCKIWECLETSEEESWGLGEELRRLVGEGRKVLLLPVFLYVK